jgi:penicillin-binding protein 1C
MNTKVQWPKIGKWAVCIAGAPLLLYATCWIALHCVALPKRLLEPQTAGLEFLDRNGRSLREVPGVNGYARSPQTFSELPKCLVNATVAAEDKRFWTHSGVDWRATLRAAWALVRNRRIISGGSTITQQLIKLSEPRPRTMATKLVEMAQALRLEQLWTKEQILAAYFNRLDYGNLTIGPAAACEFYFGKPLCDLSTAEAALLAGFAAEPHPPQSASRVRARQKTAGMGARTDRSSAEVGRL